MFQGKLHIRVLAAGAGAAVEQFGIALHLGVAADRRELMAAFGRSVLLLITGALAGAVGRQIRLRAVRAFATTEERNRVIEIFGRHASPEVVDRLLAQHGELPSE